MSVLIVSIARMLYGKAKQGSIAVLGAFFDDSGIHGTSPVVAIGGLLGTEVQWDEFDSKWKAALAAPAPDKPPLKDFHLSHCRAASGAFRDYKPVEREFTIGKFRDVILDVGLVTVAAAVDKAAWDDLVTGDVAAELGDALGLCFYKCVEASFGVIRTRRPGEPIMFFFDQGTQRELDTWTRLFKAQTGIFPELDAMGFLKVSEHTPLQGADYIANNTYQYAQECLRNAENPTPDPIFECFMKRELSCGLIFGREQIEEIVERVKSTISSRG